MSQTFRTMLKQQKAMAWALLMTTTMVRKAVRSANAPDFTQLRRLMGYVERFSESQHQANEERHLFRPVETREPGLARIVARLRREHAAMKGYRIRLDTALKHWEQGDPTAGSHAALVAEDYFRLCQSHVRTERRELLPASRKLFTDPELAGIERAFASVADPLAAATSREQRVMALKSVGRPS